VKQPGAGSRIGRVGGSGDVFRILTGTPINQLSSPQMACDLRKRSWGGRSGVLS